MSVENTEGGDLRPVRRTEKLVVREVGDELVAYALDTEQVTALDPVSAQIFQRLDGSSDLSEIAEGSGLALAEVESAVARLDDADLIASGFDRRRFIRFAAAGVSAGALLTIAAPSAMAAGSQANVTIPANTSCSPNKKKYELTVSGTGFVQGPLTVTVNLTFTTPASTGAASRNVTVAANGTFSAAFTGPNSVDMSTAVGSQSGLAKVTTTGSQTYTKTGISIGGC